MIVLYPHFLQQYPTLSVVTSIVLKSLKEDFCMEEGTGCVCVCKSLMEGLFSLFFSQFRTSFHDVDCRWFLKLANQNPKLTSQDHDKLENGDEMAPVNTHLLYACGTTGIFKFYLSRILHESESNHGSNVLRLHDVKVCCFLILGTSYYHKYLLAMHMYILLYPITGTENGWTGSGWWQGIRNSWSIYPSFLPAGRAVGYPPL